MNAQVTYEIKTEPENDLDPMDVFDFPETLAWIEQQLKDGNELAWCNLVVEAKAGSFVGWDALGGTSCESDEHLEAIIEEHDMKARALEDLRRKLTEAVTKGKEAEELLRTLEWPTD